MACIESSLTVTIKYNLGFYFYSLYIFGLNLDIIQRGITDDIFARQP